jgi:hypothetical protein
MTPRNSHPSHWSHSSHSFRLLTPCSTLHAPRSPLLALCPLLLALLPLAGCTSLKPLRGGKATTAAVAGGLAQSLAQSENSSQPSNQSQETIKIRTYTLPAGTRISSGTLSPTLSPTLSIPARRAEAPSEGGSQSPPDTQYAIRNTASAPAPTVITLDAPLPVTEREEVRARSELGAAQKDTARELGAKLASLKGIVWVGLVLFIFGLATMVWPPLKLIIGSVTTSAAVMAGGLALMILPTLIVGNELLILGGVAVLVGCWFLAHRHGHLHGLLSEKQSSPIKTQKSPVERQSSPIKNQKSKIENPQPLINPRIH